MPEFQDFLPLVAEDTNTIRARLDADANAGVDPSDDAFIDTTEGGFYWDLTQAPVLELDRLWDFLGTEVPSAMFPAYAFGDYLDDWGVSLGVARKDAAAASGEVTFTGDDDTLVATHTQVSAPSSDPDADPVVFETTDAGTITGGTLTLPVAALVAGAAGNQPAGAVTVLESPLPGITAVSNANAITGGADIETDDLYRDRILLAFNPGGGAGTVTDYEQWALAYPGVGHVTVEPLWAGNGTVRVVITDENNQPVSAAIIDGLQAELDPVPGEGEGLAPIGATVTVATPAVVGITVAADLVLDSGYSLDGASGTIDIEGDIIAAVTEYIDTLAPNDDVILERVKAIIIEVSGVHDITTATLNGSAANVVIGALEVAQTTAVNLT